MSTTRAKRIGACVSSADPQPALMASAVTEWSEADYARAALDMLPDTPEEIAEFFRVQGIKGERGNCWTCPIARWVSRWAGTDVWAGSLSIGDDRSGLRAWTMDTPFRAAMFMVRFDRGEVTL